MMAYAALQQLASPATSVRRGEGASSTSSKVDLGYGLLLKRYTPNVVDATPEQISRPRSTTRSRTSRRCSGRSASWSASASGSCSCSPPRSTCSRARTPGAATAGCCGSPCGAFRCPGSPPSCGWIVAEYGRQPWTISEVLPTHLSASSVSPRRRSGSASPASSFSTRRCSSIELYLMFKYARLGPSVARHRAATHGDGAPAGAHDLRLRLRDAEGDLVGARRRPHRSASRSSTASTSASASCCPSSAVPTTSGASRSTRSARPGRATRSG